MTENHVFEGQPDERKSSEAERQQSESSISAATPNGMSAYGFSSGLVDMASRLSPDNPERQFLVEARRYIERTTDALSRAESEIRLAEKVISRFRRRIDFVKFAINVEELP